MLNKSRLPSSPLIWIVICWVYLNKKSHELLVQFAIYGRSWCYESSQIALTVNLVLKFWELLLSKHHSRLHREQTLEHAQRRTFWSPVQQSEIETLKEKVTPERAFFKKWKCAGLTLWTQKTERHTKTATVFKSHSASRQFRLDGMTSRLCGQVAE